MLRHFITKYEESGVKYAESWIQLNLLGLSWCFSKKKVQI